MNKKNTLFFYWIVCTVASITYTPVYAIIRKPRKAPNESSSCPPATPPQKETRAQKRRRIASEQRTEKNLSASGQATQTCPAETIDHGPQQFIIPGRPNNQLAHMLTHNQIDQTPIPETAIDQAVLPREMQNEFNAEILAQVAKAPACPPPALAEEEHGTIEFHFEDADLQNFITQIEEIFSVTFITDDAITPLKQGSKPLKGNKISFKTHKPLTKKNAWNLFVTFLNLAGFTILPDPLPDHYRIKAVEAALKSPVPQYIGVDFQSLPDSDQMIRYIYFIENATIDTIKTIVDATKSPSAPVVYLNEHRAFIITDSAYNIKTLMNIVHELDTICMPQAMSVLKLKRADAVQVKQLYESLLPSDKKDAKTPLFNPRKPSSSEFFPENTKIIAEPRTNSLILLGSKDAITKIENFVTKHIDIELQQPYSPLYVYQVKYADATNLAEIMNNVTKFGKGTQAGQVGGVRGVDKYLSEMSFIAEKSTNRIIIRGDYEDYLMALNVLEKLDEPQPQVAIEMLILTLSARNQRELGAQIRSKEPGPNGLLGNKVEFQTSGLFAGGAPHGIVTRNTGPGFERLLGDLVNLVVGAPAGNTVVSLGTDLFGVWGIFQALQTITNTDVVSNPFLMATNKTKAGVAIGTTRRVLTSSVAGGADDVISGQGNEPAALAITVIPQINSDGMIVLDLLIDINEFTDPGDPTSPNKNIRQINTKTIISDGEILALGGLIRDNIQESTSKTPVLGDVPIVGWLFKNKRKIESKDNLLILLSAKIINPLSHADVANFTRDRILDYRGSLDEMHTIVSQRDPIHRMFFTSRHDNKLDDFIFNRQNQIVEDPEQAKKQREMKARYNPVTPDISKDELVEQPLSAEQFAQFDKPVPHANDVVLAEAELDNALRRKKHGGMSLSAFLSSSPDIPNPPPPGVQA